MSETVEQMILRYEREIANLQNYSAAYPVWRSTFKILLSLLQRIHTLESNIAKLEERLSPPEQKCERQNMFHNCDTVGEVIGQAVGAGSVCWLEQNGEEIFDSERALQVADDAEERILQLQEVSRGVKVTPMAGAARTGAGHLRASCSHNIGGIPGGAE